MINVIGNDGRLDPSHEHLAKVAKVAASTVRRALDRLKASGFLDWTRRLIRTKAGCRQTSNAYVLRLTDPDAHFDRPVDLLEKSKRAQGQESREAPAWGSLEALRAVRRRRETRLAEVWMARRA